MPESERPLVLSLFDSLRRFQLEALFLFLLPMGEVDCARQVGANLDESAFVHAVRKDGGGEVATNAVLR